MTSPVALVLYDVHALRNSECPVALSVLADHLPARSPLALAGRDQLPVRIAGLRVEGRILALHGPLRRFTTQLDELRSGDVPTWTSGSAFDQPWASSAPGT